MDNKLYNILKIKIQDIVKAKYDLHMDSEKEFKYLVQQQHTPLFEQIKIMRGYDNRNIKELIFVEARQGKKKIENLKRILKEGFSYNGRLYKRFGKSASQAKDGITVFIDAEYYDEIIERSQLGVKIDKCVVSKYESYRCLILSACQLITGRLPNIVMVDEFTKVIPNQYVRYAIHKDMEVVDKDTKQVKVYKNQRVIEEGYQDIEISPFDGFGVHTEEMSEVWGRILGLEYTPIAYQVRLPFLKGVSIQAPIKDILKNHCGVTEITDIFGKTHSVDSIDCIWNVSLWKGYGIFKNKFGDNAWTEYLKRIEQYNFNLGISKYNHHIDNIELYSGSNFQYLQCLDLINPKYVEHFKNNKHSKDPFDFLDANNWGKMIDIAKYSTNLYEKIINGDKLYTLKYLGLVNGSVGKLNNKYMQAIMINDIMLKDICIKRTLRRMLNKTINQMKFGKILTSGFYHLVVGDILGYLEHCAKVEVKGCLNAGEFYCKTMPLGECLSMRSPLVDPSEVNKINIVENDLTRKYFDCFDKHDVCMVNMYDISTAQQGGMDFDGDLVNLCNEKIMLNSVIRKPIVVDMTDKKSADPVDYNIDNIIVYECNTRDNRIGEITNIATSILNQVNNNEEWQKINNDNVSLLRLYQGKEIDFVKTSYRWIITRNLRRYLKKLPYFLLFNYPQKLSVYDKIKSLNKTIRKKEDRLPYNAYMSPSPLNELCMYICEWEKRRVIWNNKATNTRDYLINHSLPTDNKHIWREVKKLCNDFTSQFYSLIKKQDSLPNENTLNKDDLDCKIDLLFEKYRNKLSEINIDKEVLANYCVEICYGSKNRDKVFCWSMFGDIMLENLRMNSLGVESVEIVETTKDDMEAKEYMGRHYKIAEGFMRKLYLNELLDDYKDGRDIVKQRRLDKFKRELWNSSCEIEIYSRYFSIRVVKDLLDNREDLTELFNKYRKIEYKVCKSQHKEILPQSIDYIRLHVNNMYTYLFDKDVYYDKEYYALLKTARNEYFKIVKSKNADNVDIDVVRNTIETALKKAEEIKQVSINKKFNLSWGGYQRLINSFIDKIFDNYKSIEEYEKDKEWDIDVEVDGWNEDNFIVSYFCKSLNGYMRNYMRQLKSGKYRLCDICETLIKRTNNKLKYCPECAREVWNENRVKYNEKYYDKIKNK